MSVCAVILAGLQGKYAFYAAMPVALTFGKKFKNFILLYSVDVRVYANHKVFSLRAAFSPTPVLTNLDCICWKNYTITVQSKFPETTSEDSNDNNKNKDKKSSSPHGPKCRADCQHPHPSHKSWCCCRVALVIGCIWQCMWIPLCFQGWALEPTVL